jgi:PBP1b-binding outer membrane lipoprotein LpoB
LYGFLNLHGFDATDEELIAIIRRIEGRGNGKVDFDEFVQALDPIIVKMHDIHQVEDQGENMAKNTTIHKENTTPFLKRMPNN